MPRVSPYSCIYECSKAAAGCHGARRSVMWHQVPPSLAQEVQLSILTGLPARSALPAIRSAAPPHPRLGLSALPPGTIGRALTLTEPAYAGQRNGPLKDATSYTPEPLGVSRYVASVRSGCRDKMPRAGGLNKELFPHSSRGSKSEVKVSGGWASLLRPCSLACGWPPSRRVPAWPSLCECRHPVSVPALRRTPVLLDQGPP